jgi:hypothetical protein
MPTNSTPHTAYNCVSCIKLLAFNLQSSAHSRSYCRLVYVFVSYLSMLMEHTSSTFLISSSEKCRDKFLLLPFDFESRLFICLLCIPRVLESTFA